MVKDDARGRWYELLHHFGIPYEFLKDKHGPCPMCDGTDRFRWDDKDGNGTYYCNVCGAGDGFDLAMKYTGREFKDIAGEIEKMSGKIQIVENKEKPDPAIRINKTTSMITLATGGTPVGRYLKSRGIMRGNGGIGYIQNYPYYENGTKIGNFPVMACQIVSEDFKLLSYHLTYLTDDGRKADLASVKKILPPISTITGCSIKFGIGEHVIVAEGIENTLSAMQDFGLPGHAGINAECLEKMNFPASVKRVTIIGDNDENYRGQKAAYTLANRLSMMGIDVVDVIIPKQKGTDYNSNSQPM